MFQFHEFLSVGVVQMYITGFQNEIRKLSTPTIVKPTQYKKFWSICLAKTELLSFHLVRLCGGHHYLVSEMGPHGLEDDGEVIADGELVVELVAAARALDRHVELDETGREMRHGLSVLYHLVEQSKQQHHTI